MGIVLASAAQVHGGQNLADRVDGQPEPEGVLYAAYLGVQLVELDQGQVQVAEEQVVETAAVTAHPLQPAGDGGVGVAGVADHHRDVHALGQQPQDHLDAVGCCLQIIEGCVAPTREVPTAALAAEMLDVSILASLAVADQRMHVFSGDAVVVAVWMGTGVAFRLNLFLASPTALALRIGLYALIDGVGLELYLSTTVGAILGRLGFPAAGQPFLRSLPNPSHPPPTMTPHCR